MTATPSPTPAATPAPARSAADRRSLALMLLLTVGGAGLVLLAAGRTWTQGQVKGLALSASGSEVSGLPGALALVGLASAVAIFAVRGAGRYAVGALVTLAGLGAALAAGFGAVDSGAVDGEAAKKLGLLGTTAERVSHTAWPWVALLGGLLLAAAGLLTLLRGRAWPSMGSRYDAPVAKKSAAAKPAGAVSSPAELWKALDRGEDPTAV
ncbi:TIGR02234 family membrane protein [Kitasatospora sp. NBC_01287]|uniref:TIGR02234 family membrane protein n=1 Tax=Kitasatospora sp. NBC_01287 TaxID=2903573 RepID=UPI00225185B8|nr:TIGR02234 family membrane protein [Kitasatospora sp. NBC_01287]MCX4749667.1 TIGR02234 family membrane protein [Kitasatospora sp. NBC_01287]